MLHLDQIETQVNDLARYQMNKANARKITESSLILADFTGRARCLSQSERAVIKAHLGIEPHGVDTLLEFAFNPNNGITSREICENALQELVCDYGLTNIDVFLFANKELAADFATFICLRLSIAQTVREQSVTVLYFDTHDHTLRRFTGYDDTAELLCHLTASQLSRLYAADITTTELHEEMVRMLKP